MRKLLVIGPGDAFLGYCIWDPQKGLLVTHAIKKPWDWNYAFEDAKSRCDDDIIVTIVMHWRRGNSGQGYLYDRSKKHWRVWANKEGTHLTDPGFWENDAAYGYKDVLEEPINAV